MYVFNIASRGGEKRVFFILTRRGRKILERVVKLLKTELNGKGQKKKKNGRNALNVSRSRTSVTPVVETSISHGITRTIRAL